MTTHTQKDVEPIEDVQEPQEVVIDRSPERKEDETQAEYNARVPIGQQPVLPGPTKSYLGEDL